MKKFLLMITGIFSFLFFKEREKSKSYKKKLITQTKGIRIEEDNKKIYQNDTTDKLINSANGVRNIKGK